MSNFDELKNTDLKHTHADKPVTKTVNPEHKTAGKAAHKAL